MESWNDVVSSYPETPEPKDYAKAICSAEIILSEELAPFETEWLAQTLLFVPVGLFETISSKRASEEWLKTIADSFKILSKIVEKCWDVVENYYNDIIVIKYIILKKYIDTYINIWRVLLDNTTGPDLRKAVGIFEDTLQHILEVLASFTGDSEKIIYVEQFEEDTVLSKLLSRE